MRALACLNVGARVAHPMQPDPQGKQCVLDIASTSRTQHTRARRKADKKRGNLRGGPATAAYSHVHGLCMMPRLDACAVGLMHASTSACAPARTNPLMATRQTNPPKSDPQAEYNSNGVKGGGGHGRAVSICDADAALPPYRGLSYKCGRVKPHRFGMRFCHSAAPPSYVGVGCANVVALASPAAEGRSTGCPRRSGDGHRVAM